MIRVIQLMSEKNHFLEKFMSLNEKQILRFESGNYDQIELFYNQREDLLKIIKYIDAETNKAQLAIKQSSVMLSDAERKTIKESLKTKDNYTAKILDQDMHVLSLIDRAKSKIITELREVRKGQRAMAGYKSQVGA
jgi:hypothetical protein